MLELQQARESVAIALDSEADIYAPEAFDLAVSHLESAEYAIAEQNAAPLWSQDYGLALEYLDLATAQAEQARSAAQEGKARLFEGAAISLSEAEARFQGAVEAVDAIRNGEVSGRELQAMDDELAAIFATLEQARGIEGNGDYRGAEALSGQARERAAAVEARARLIADAVSNFD